MQFERPLEGRCGAVASSVEELAQTEFGVQFGCFGQLSREFFVALGSGVVALCGKVLFGGLKSSKLRFIQHRLPEC